MQPSRPKPILKEKFVQITESILKGTASLDDPAGFWDTYFLLTVNGQSIHETIQNTPSETLLAQDPQTQALFHACLTTMNAEMTQALDQTRQVNAIKVLTCLIRALFLKRRLTTFNIIGLLTGLDQANAQFTLLIRTIDQLLQRQVTKPFALTLAITLVAGNDNVSQNSLNGYFIQHDLSSTLLYILNDDLSSLEERRQTLILFSFLASYNKYESRNPYLHQLSQWRQQSLLDEILEIFSQLLVEMTRKYQELKDEDESLAKSVANYMSGWFSGSTGTVQVDMDNPETLVPFPPKQAAWLLMLYDLVNTNPAVLQRIIRTFQTSTPDQPGQPAAQFLPNLMTFISYLVQHNRNERSSMYTKLMLLILLRLCEEQAFLAAITQADADQTVVICRQRLPPLPRVKKPRSLASAILDDMILFMKHNLRKKLDMAMYRLAFSITHRVLSFLYKRQIRLDYHWQELWPTLTSVLHFTMLQLDTLKTRREELVPFLAALVTLFNIALTHGETFLHDTKSFDTLFYDIIRSSDDIAALSKYLSSNMSSKPADRSPTLTMGSLANIKMVCHHLKPALDEWQETQKIKYATSSDQVMAVIQSHFDTLELAPMDKLDHYTPYNEIPHEMPFFRFLLRLVVTDYWQLHAPTSPVPKTKK